jgi:murein DD-endopeptidase MepM/ murein hydrolase activator NlpD
MEYPIDKIYPTQHFGERPHVYSQFGMDGHNGVDFRVKFNDSPKGRRYITAALSGVVIEVGNQGRGGYGRFVRMRHEGSEQTIYAHLTKPYVKKGDKVKIGDRIGLSGNTGFSSGAHLHFGYRPDGWEKIYDNGFKGYIDPMPFLEKNDVPVEVISPSPYAKVAWEWFRDEKFDLSLHPHQTVSAEALAVYLHKLYGMLNK